MRFNDTGMDEHLALEQRIAALIGCGDVSEAAFGDAALDIHRFQRARNEPFGKYCRHLGVPLEISDWRAIPAVPQGAFRQFPLRCFPENETVKTFRTSGTTGEGFGEHHFRSLQLYEASILRGWDVFHLPILPQIVLTPPPAEAPHSSLSHMMHTLRARAAGGSQRFYFGKNAASMIDSLAQSDAPVLMLGTALAFLHLFEALEKGGVLLPLPAGSFAMETGGYKGSGRSLGRAELHAMFTRFLGLAPESIVNEYGMTELSSQFYAHGTGSPHRGPDWARALVIDPETGREAEIGKTGALRIFDLANLGSVLAIQTQDLAIRRADGFELIGRDPAALPRGCSRSADEMLMNSPA